MARRVRTSPRKLPIQERSRATVDAILDATAHVLVVDGYDHASTNRVAERAGVSVGSVYQYFPNKEALVGELVDRFSRHVFAMVVDRLAELAAEPPEVTTRALIGAMVRLKREDPRLARVLREQIPRVGRMQRYERELALVVDATRKYLEGWRERLRHDDLATAAFVTVHTVDAVTHAGVTSTPPVDEETLVHHATDLVLSYLLKR
jgi:AcrR family transcriptional regulator